MLIFMNIAEFVQKPFKRKRKGTIAFQNVGLEGASVSAIQVFSSDD